jgi:Ca-activated chloride channel homolog
MKSAPNDASRDPSRADERPSPCIEVHVRWGASLLCVTHLDPPNSFFLGEDTEGVTGCFLPAALLGAARAPLVLVTEGAAELVILPGAEGPVELAGEPLQRAEDLVASPAARPIAEVSGAVAVRFPPGSRAALELHGVSLSVASVSAGRAVAGHFHLDKRALPFCVASALLQAGLLAASACFPPPPSDDVVSGVSADQVREMQTALRVVAEKEQEATEAELPAEALADAKAGGTGTRAKGEEGSMGSASRGTSSRYGIQGPADNADPHIARAAALREGAEFGMIGLLNSGSGGDPNAPAAPWGRDDALGNPLGAVSAVDVGIGLSGIGEGGGGRGIGLGNIGTIGHGAGTGMGQTYGAGVGQGDGAGARRLGGPGASNGAAGGYAERAAALAEAPLDPNGRYATTYRPGGGHLAAFESAVARGILPPATRELVSDVGARYAPALRVPDGRALAFRADLERTALPPSGGAFHVRLALTASDEKPTARPHLSVHLVLDVSGSMAGESLARAKDAAEALVDKLAPTDDFSLVTFASEAEVKVPDGSVGPRRGFIKHVIHDITELGGTNISEGLRLGYAQASSPSVPEDAVRIVFLLSDGRPNAGITGRDRLSRLALDAFQRGVQTSSFGLGSDYDGALMSSIATDGAGGYYYLRDPDQIAPALGAELDRRLDPVATAVEVRVRLKRDVDILRVYGSRRLGEDESSRVRALEVAADRQAAQRDHIKVDREDDTAGGMRFFIPAFARGDSHAMLLALRAPAGVGGRAIASVELKYKDRIGKRNVVEELLLKLTFAGSDAESAASRDASVARTIQGFAAGEALTEASSRIAVGDRSGAASLLAEREQILRQAATSLGEPLFQRDADRLARLRARAEGEGAADPLVLAMLLESAGRAHLR